ncbi:type 1 fimbrial protein [Pseudomonas taiwanensis]|uniref:fimbrial protein n=1 Tax=Pseudomonas taiwanensis TaxID=470150 RepID=UPI0028DECF58|nr:type 1 fimbrial protein [Pseudomonas taiwanensis]MDT8921771.1 type 1 fimbrial protein [Pseudomonas taiwanensis]
MIKPIKTLLALTTTSIIAAISTSTMAADGTINFTGEIVAASCTVSAGSGTSLSGAAGDQIIDVKLGKVSSNSLNGVAGSGVVAGQSVNLNVDCGKTAADLAAVKMEFDPVGGSGVDAKNPGLLRTTGTATGVSIGIYNTANKLLNLSSNESIRGVLSGDATAGYKTRLSLRAAYVANGYTVKPGSANGTLPFTLTYE